MEKWEQEIIKRFGTQYIRGTGTDNEVYKIIGVHGKPSYEEWVLQSMMDGACYVIDDIDSKLYTKVRQVTKEIEEFVPCDPQPSTYRPETGGLFAIHDLGTHGYMKKKTVTTWEPIQ